MRHNPARGQATYLIELQRVEKVIQLSILSSFLELHVMLLETM